MIVGGLAGAGSGWLASHLGYAGHFALAGVLGLAVLVPAWLVLWRNPQLRATRPEDQRESPIPGKD